MSLKKYILEQNLVATWCKQPMLPEDPKLLTAEQKTQLGQRLSSDLSPEALTCDGERRGAKLQARVKLLAAERKDLEALGVTVTVY